MFSTFFFVLLYQVLILDLDSMKNIRKIGLPVVVAFLFQVPTFSQTKSLIELVEIPAGSYYMGSEGKGENFDEAPAHIVNISKGGRICSKDWQLSNWKQNGNNFLCYILT